MAYNSRFSIKLLFFFLSTPNELQQELFCQLHTLVIVYLLAIAIN